MTKPLLAVLVMVLILSGCGHRVAVDVDKAKTAPQTSAATTARAPTSAANVLITEDDITDRRYQSLGDVEVTLSKWTAFDKMPDRTMVAERLRKEAAGMGADAVILVRYGQPGMGVFTWGKMEGRGRAIVFVE